MCTIGIFRSTGAVAWRLVHTAHGDLFLNTLSTIISYTFLIQPDSSMHGLVHSPRLRSRTGHTTSATFSPWLAGHELSV